MGAVAYVCCVLLVLFASVSVHRVSHFITATLMTIALPSAMMVMFRRRHRCRSTTTPTDDAAAAAAAENDVDINSDKKIQ